MHSHPSAKAAVDNFIPVHGLYGGDQGACHTDTMRRWGCGVIGCCNVLLTLVGKTLTQKEFTALSEDMGKHMHILPWFGLTGFGLQRGMNRYFRKNAMAYRARWRHSDMMERIVNMLTQNIPVVLAVGPNFPNLLGKRGVTLHSAAKTAHNVHDHYVTVTAVDGADITVSSWGRRYIMNWNEFMRYSKSRGRLFCGVLEIRRTK